MFSSGMPLCAAVVCVVFSMAILIDRIALTKLMIVNAYGPQLPRLILGELRPSARIGLPGLWGLCCKQGNAGRVSLRWHVCPSCASMLPGQSDAPGAVGHAQGMHSAQRPPYRDTLYP